MRRNKNRIVKVTLRFRMLNTGKQTLYLDYYPPIKDPETGNPSRREYLGMFVTPLKKETEIIKQIIVVNTNILLLMRKLSVWQQSYVIIGKMSLTNQKYIPMQNEK